MLSSRDACKPFRGETSLFLIAKLQKLWLKTTQLPAEYCLSTVESNRTLQSVFVINNIDMPA